MLASQRVFITPLIYMSSAMSRLTFFSAFLLVLTTVSLVHAAPSKKMPANDAYDAYSDARGSYYSDPLEPFNRAVFGFNTYFDRYLLRPAARGYQHLPGFVQTGTHNFLSNLMSPVSMFNELLQGDLTGFNITTWRFITNTILGVGGLVDVADNVGRAPIPREDFGQTLGYYGVGAGPYLVLPILGPSNVRDLTGRVVDIVTDPLNLYAWNTDRNWIPITRGVLTAVDTRSQLMGPYDDIMHNSVDPYSSFRSVYSQNRAYAVRHHVYETGGAMDDAYTMTENTD